MEILCKVETEDIPDMPDRTKDTEICRRTMVLENLSINENMEPN